MPGGAGSEFVLLEYENVSPAQMSQVVGDAGADDTATNYYDSSPGGELRRCRGIAHTITGLRVLAGSIAFIARKIRVIGRVRN